MKRRRSLVVGEVQIGTGLDQRPGHFGLAECCCNDQGRGPPRIFFIQVRTGLNVLPNGFDVPLKGCQVEAQARSWGLLCANRQRCKDREN